MDAKKLNNLTVAEYIQIEEDANQKYEYHDGRIYALAGGSLNHGLICGNIFGELRSGLREKGDECKAMTSEIKLYIQSENAFVYPDAMVVCGEINKSTKNRHAIINPIIIVEVLSKSTESYDRGDKFYKYRQIQSLQEYILIDQSKPQIEIYRRQNELWQITRVSGLDKSISIHSTGIEIKLSDIYQDVDFSDEN